MEPFERIDEVHEAKKPLEHCPICGQDLKLKKSFKGRKHYRTKRMTQVCTGKHCDWASILLTTGEAMIETGII